MDRLAVSMASLGEITRVDIQRCSKAPRVVMPSRSILSFLDIHTYIKSYDSDAFERVLLLVIIRNNDRAESPNGQGLPIATDPKTLEAIAGEAKNPEHE
jgi:hypothetical protein